MGAVRFQPPPAASTPAFNEPSHSQTLALRHIALVTAVKPQQTGLMGRDARGCHASALVLGGLPRGGHAAATPPFHATHRSGCMV